MMVCQGNDAGACQTIQVLVAAIPFSIMMFVHTTEGCDNLPKIGACHGHTILYTSSNTIHLSINFSAEVPKLY